MIQLMYGKPDDETPKKPINANKRLGAPSKVVTKKIDTSDIYHIRELVAAELKVETLDHFDSIKVRMTNVDNKKTFRVQVFVNRPFNKNSPKDPSGLFVWRSYFVERVLSDKSSREYVFTPPLTTF